MKRAGIASAVVAMAMATAHISGQANQGGQSEKPLNPAGRPAHLDVELGAREFINDMAVAGMAEVQLGKMSADRASDSGVKAFGRMMVTDHSRANDELKRVASQLNVTLPMQLDQKHRDLADRLSKLQGTAFDRAYIDAMVQGHQEVVAKLRSRAAAQSTSTGAGANRPGSGATPAAAGTQNEEALGHWATKTLPTVQQHLEQARNLQQKIAK